MSYTTYQKHGKGPEDLIKTDMLLKDFSANTTQTSATLNAELTILNETLSTTLFVIGRKGSHSLLLGRDWSQTNCNVPSMMHQCLIQLHGDDVELVHTDAWVSVETTDSLI